MRKAASSVLLVCILIGALTACSAAGSTAVSGDFKTESSGEASEKDRTISFWCIATEDPDAEIMKYAVDKFNRETTTGYHVELTAIQNDKYKQKLVIAMSSGECPDMYTTWSGGPMDEYIDSGFGRPITDLYREAGLDRIYMPAATAQASYKGGIYAVPVINTVISGIFYNKELFDQYGLKEPKTITELEQICDTLKSNGITPFALANSSKWQGDMFYQGLATRYDGLEDFRKAYSGGGSFEAPCFRYAGRKIQEWVRKGYFPAEANSLSSDDGQDQQMLYHESAAMLYSGSWYTSTFKQESNEFYEKIGWFPFPECDESANGAAYAEICNGTIGDQFISFNCTGKKLQAAFECVRHYSDDEEIQNMINAGKIPPICNVQEKLKDPLMLKICKYAEAASDVQLWYDQFLPTEVAADHLDISQKLFGLSITPEEACRKTQEAMAEYLSNRQ